MVSGRMKARAEFFRALRHGRHTEYLLLFGQPTKVVAVVDPGEYHGIHRKSDQVAQWLMNIPILGANDITGEQVEQWFGDQ